MSLILRHRPEKFGLEMDEQGYVSIEDLAEAISSTRGWSFVTKKDILEIVSKSEKERFEVDEEKIRACYGHSLPAGVIYYETEPPRILYHGTARSFLKKIEEKGLLPMGRQYVHLSVSEESARMVGRRRDRHPMILEIDAGKAFRDGIKFFKATENVYLVRKLPSKYIRWKKSESK